MIEVIFSVDYEIYGNGQGSIKELVVDPGAALLTAFRDHDAKIVVFAEAAEFERISECGTDAHISEVPKQLRDFRKDGHEIALHLHPQWFNARWTGAEWQLDYGEYGLGALSPQRNMELIGRGCEYLRRALDDSSFVPHSFRAGNWLLQPTVNISPALVQAGIKLDSSVFRGGLQSDKGLDYRRAPRRPYWRFSDNVIKPDPSGTLLEIPIFTRLVPSWTMLSRKRLGVQKKNVAAGKKTKTNWRRLVDFARFSYPLKFDFCRMTFEQMKETVEFARRNLSPSDFLPLVAIGHTKDLVDIEGLRRFLKYLNVEGIRTTTYQSALVRCS